MRATRLSYLQAFVWTKRSATLGRNQLAVKYWLRNTDVANKSMGPPKKLSQQSDSPQAAPGGAALE